MSLQKGTLAPDFTLSSKSPDGLHLINLKTLLSEGKPVVLLFFPMAFTGVCTQEFCSQSQKLEEYSKLDANVLGISGDNPFAQEAWAIKEDISIPLLSDYEHTVAKAYGVAYDSFLPENNLPMGGVAKRSAFVICPKGEIHYAECHDDAHDLPDFNAIMATLEDLHSHPGK